MQCKIHEIKIDNKCLKNVADVRFEVFTVVTMKKAVFWDVTPCRSGVNRRFGGKYRLHLQGRGKKKENPHAKRPSEALKADWLKAEWQSSDIWGRL
jgi:hypothetical protein